MGVGCQEGVNLDYPGYDRCDIMGREDEEAPNPLSFQFVFHTLTSLPHPFIFVFWTTAQT